MVTKNNNDFFLNSRKNAKFLKTNLQIFKTKKILLKFRKLIFFYYKKNLLDR